MDGKLTEYLKTVVSLEKSVYIQQQTIQGIRYQINQLGISRKFTEPSPPSEYQADIFEDSLYWAGAGLIISAILAPGLMIIGAIAGIVIKCILNNHAAEEERAMRMSRYWGEKHKYDNAVAQDRMRVEREKTERFKLFETIDMMEKELKQTSELLNRFYTMDIIYPKYRNLVAMCSIYEYFLSGRCESLTGHEGAYNIFENEVRFERIYTKLDEIVSRLDDIRENQYILYDAIQEGNRTTRTLVDASVKQAKLTQSIAENSEISAYYNRQTALEANQMKWLMLHESWKNQ